MSMRPDQRTPDGNCGSSLAEDAAGSLLDAPSIPFGGSGPQLADDPLNLAPGQLLLDFQIHRILGKGAFGTVYLALQISLDRFVAVKIARDVGAEGRTMARLEHPNVVQVFTEQAFAGRPLRLLCMQYVPGPTLQSVLTALRERHPDNDWNGGDLLHLIDTGLQGPGLFSPGEFQNRSRLEQMSRVEAVCCWGQQLADGLQFAHTSGVLHHDIKPANILLSASGRPMLADFNLAESTDRDDSELLLGGTLLYMAPEKLAAFLKLDPLSGGIPTDVGDGDLRNRADIFSLGLVLIELLQGRLPAPKSFAESPQGGLTPMQQVALLGFRQQGPSVWASGQGVSAVEPEVITVLCRACDPDPRTRTSSSGRLAEELHGCFLIRQLAATRARRSRLLPLAERLPLLCFLVLTLFPHVVGSVVNVAYNFVRVPDLARARPASAVLAGDPAAASELVVSAFHRIALGYNALVWPIGIAAMIVLMARNQLAIRGGPFSTESEEQRRRRRLLDAPRQMLAVAAFGWLPGLIVFPVGLLIGADVPIAASLRHFGLNLLMSGSIAFSYSWMGATWLILSVCYLRLWRFPAGLTRGQVREETERLVTPLRWCRTAAGLVPLMSAILIVVVSPAASTQEQYTVFRVLLTTLIAVGMLGYHFSVQLTDSLTQGLSGFTRTGAPLGESAIQCDRGHSRL